MKNRRFRKTLVMILIFVLVTSNFMSVATFAAETTNFVKVHIKENVDAVKIEYYTPVDTFLDLTEQGSFWQNLDEKEFISTNIKSIWVTTGTTDKEYTPASDYEGVEGGGTINYWLSEGNQIIINKDVPNVNSDETDFNFITRY